MNRKIAAHYLCPIVDKPIKNGIITIDESGKILDISEPSGSLDRIAGLEFYSGILVPGFVNTHCHLELSHMKSKIPMHTGLPGFVSQINKHRQADSESIIKAAIRADISMQYNGIVAVGDISNNENTFTVKKESKIHYHSFLEIFSLNPALANEKFEQAVELENILTNLKLSASIVPHAPYSVTPEMFKLIEKHAFENKKAISIHNQETKSENEFFQSKSGELAELFVKAGFNLDGIKATGKNSLESIMIHLPKSVKIILVHNTFTQKEDIEKASAYFENLYWAMCPNANLYIENKLPDIPLFYKMGQKITLGTDSLASNHQLSILEEMKTIHQYYPEIPINELFKWATLNGAEALDLSVKFRSFEIGKTPGINLIHNFDIQNFRIKPESQLKKLN